MKKRFAWLLCLILLIGLLPGCSQMDEKPVIYLYPEEETEVTVKLDYNGTLTSTYPAYGDGWTVTAQPDGTPVPVRKEAAGEDGSTTACSGRGRATLLTTSPPGTV